MALTYLLTTRGIPQLFYGTEVLMENTGHHKNDGLIRSDFPGGWKEDTVNAFSGKGLSPQQLDMQIYLKKLLNWRKSNPVIATGKTLHFAPSGGVYVYFRYTKEAKVMVVMNKSKQAQTLNLAKYSEILKAGSTVKNVVTDEIKTLGNTLSVAGTSAVIFEVN